MKCNEGKPQCHNCHKSGLECVWPNLNFASLPHGANFKVQKTQKKIGTDFIFYEKPAIESKNGNDRDNVTEGYPIDEKVETILKDPSSQPSPFSPCPTFFSRAANTSTNTISSASSMNFQSAGDYSFDKDIGTLLNSPRFQDLVVSTVDHCPPPSTMFLLSDSSVSDQEDNDRIIQEYSSPVTYESRLGYSPLTGAASWNPGDYTVVDSQFLHAFINGFMPAVSPQFCHPRLQPRAVFLPHGQSEPLMQELFFACGAAFMGGNNPDLKAVAERKYHTVFNKFTRRLSQSNGVIEEWMVVATLLFTLRDKFTGTTLELPVAHLSQTINLIRTLRAQLGDYSITMKFFVESFLFNYSVMLISGGKMIREMQLPSPFEIFDECRRAFNYRPFRCAVPFMNNPVFGAASLAFELAAKASWLVSKCPLDKHDMVIVCDLLGETYRMERPEIRLGPGDKISAQEFVQLQESVAVSDVTILACQLLLLRMLNPGLLLLHDIVKERVKQIITLFRLFSIDTQLWVVCSWLLLVTGLSLEDLIDRQFIQEVCYRSARTCRAAFLIQVAQFLERAWGTNEDPGPGWSLLYSSALSKSICL